MSRTTAQILDHMLTAAENASPVEAVEAVTGEIGEALGARAISFLSADVSGRALVRLAHVPLDRRGAPGPDESGQGRDETGAVEALPFDGGPYERTLRSQEMTVDAVADQWRMLAPVTQRGEVLGLLEIELPTAPTLQVREDVARTAHTLAFVVLANRRHTDMFEQGQRTTPFSLSAEIQSRLLPAPFTCEASAFTLSGWLEPSASIAGDTFDYSLSRDTLHFSVTDAMGHGVGSALTATLGVSALRTARQTGRTLTGQGEAANDAVSDYPATADAYMTALLGSLDLRTGVCRLVNAGHVPPTVVRATGVDGLTLPRNYPCGMFADATYRSGEVSLVPGDRLVVVTDGMQDRNAPGFDFASFLEPLRDLHPREAVRALTDVLLERAGAALADDATVLMIDWYGGHGHDRHTRSGADPARASATPQ